MDRAVFFGFLALLMLWYNLYVSTGIIRYLRAKDPTVSLFNGGFFIKGKIFTYLPRYRERTLKETGTVGSLYVQFYFSFILLVVFLVLGILYL